MRYGILPLGVALLLSGGNAIAADTPKVALQPRLEAAPDGSRELVIDARIEPGWILYASDFEQPQIGPSENTATHADEEGSPLPLSTESGVFATSTTLLLITDPSAFVQPRV